MWEVGAERVKTEQGYTLAKKKTADMYNWQVNPPPKYWAEKQQPGLTRERCWFRSGFLLIGSTWKISWRRADRQQE